MAHTEYHISKRLITLLLAFVLVLPSVVKFSHALSLHEHEICIGENQTHLHEIDLDCEFFKFKINHNSLVVFNNYDIDCPTPDNTLITEYYLYLISHQQDTFYLRGPPHLM
ncbi:hypothetical protein [uncultured Psychroserpens sp.]|uniref:hypothetical protein n=1 Tax=uncultured Psychroserpens sp. TaxID=255436 RepID=UPI002610C645|nr:hypothetical protein [uncultured Psychroserpens sp.]